MLWIRAYNKPSRRVRRWLDFNINCAIIVWLLFERQSFDKPVGVVESVSRWDVYQPALSSQYAAIS